MKILKFILFILVGTTIGVGCSSDAKVKMVNVGIDVLVSTKLTQDPKNAKIPSDFVAMMQPMEYTDTAFVPKVNVVRVDINSELEPIEPAIAVANKMRRSLGTYTYDNLKEDYTKLSELTVPSLLKEPTRAPQVEETRAGYDPSVPVYYLSDTTLLGKNTFSKVEDIMGEIKKQIEANKKTKFVIVYKPIVAVTARDIGMDNPSPNVGDTESMTLVLNKFKSLVDALVGVGTDPTNAETYKANVVGMFLPDAKVEIQNVGKPKETVSIQDYVKRIQTQCLQNLKWENVYIDKIVKLDGTNAQTKVRFTQVYLSCTYSDEVQKVIGVELVPETTATGEVRLLPRFTGIRVVGTPQQIQGKLSN